MFMKNLLKCIVYNPVAWQTAWPVVAAIRGGGSGVFSLAAGEEKELRQRFEEATRFISKDSLGIRLSLDTLTNGEMSEVSLCHPAFLIVSAESGLQRRDTLPATASELLSSQPVMWEVNDPSEFSTVRSWAPRIDGWIVAGTESGGRVGYQSTVVLLQDALKSGVPEPVAVRGGFGLIGAAGMMAAGASGIVLDDQILLLKESPWSHPNYSFLQHLNGTECVVLGDRFGVSHRFLMRPEFPAAQNLPRRLQELESSQKSDEEIAAEWLLIMRKAMTWKTDSHSIWPVGQAIGLAPAIAREFKTVGKLVQAVLNHIPKLIQQTDKSRPFDRNASLARSHRTEFPVVQGPMTRVSDCATFAAEVSRAGGLPILALALMKGEQVTNLANETAQMLNGAAWGVGILGFVPPEIRSAQVEAVIQAQPPFALIAGARPDQAAELERHGIATYVHVPVPSLLSSYLKQGLRRFVLEGRESGGHVGPLGSLMLWEHAVRVLTTETSIGGESDIHVLFAGGIHDARSAAIAALFASHLTERGMKTGILMGTAYIFTAEAVSSGAVVEKFQRTVRECKKTVLLESGAGQANRCADTAFAREFLQLRRKLMREGASPEQIRNELDRLGLGRLRLAAKGFERVAEGSLAPVDETGQQARGMYLIGEAAGLREDIISIRDLHSEVCENAQRLIEQSARAQGGDSPRASAQFSTPSDIAVIGIGCILPGSEGAEPFWANLLSQTNFIREIPANHFDWCLYFHPDKNARNKSYSKWGGFIDDVRIDPATFGIPPKSLKSVSPVQLLTLEGVRRALSDAKIDPANFDGSETSLIVANGDGGGFIDDLLTARAMLPLLMPEIPADVDEMLPDWMPESFTGLLNNIASGRAANRLDLGGVNFTVDAACAGSLAAIDLAVHELEAHRCNLAIAGGTDCGNSPAGYIGFSKTQALSPDGHVRSFDKRANGIVISEGCGFLVLKRLRDAERDGDRIYGVIKSVAGSSDGRELGLTAPRIQGQIRALRRAYAKAGFGMETVEFYEAHGTGTSRGDQTELETITKFLAGCGAPPRNCFIGSHKSLIGHTKTAAGVVGTIKALMALTHRTLPPHSGVELPLEALNRPESAVALTDLPRPWFSNTRGPRRCGVSGFGFGGINYHVVIEEYRGFDDLPGAIRWPCELLFLRAENRQGLASAIEEILPRLKQTPDLAAFAHGLYEESSRFESRGAACSLVASTLAEAESKLREVLQFLRTTSAMPPAHTFFSFEENPLRCGKVAFLFPGQGSQYVGMLREPALYFEEIRKALELADKVFVDLSNEKLTRRIFPPQHFSNQEADEHTNQLKHSRYAQPALAASSMGLLQLLQQLGIEPAVCAGHSFGELIALHAARAMDAENLVRLAELRGRLMSKADSSGMMAAIVASEGAVSDAVNKMPGLTLANINSPKQTVISGEANAVKNAVAECQKRGIHAVLLPVGGAYHSPSMSSIVVPLHQAVQQLHLSAPGIPVYSNETGGVLPKDPHELRSLIESHPLKPVQFLSMIRNMHHDGARIFVEVGPNRLLKGLMSQCLEGLDCCVLSLDDGSGQLAPLLSGIGALACLGVIPSLASLWSKRIVASMSLQPAPARKSSTDWYVNGASVWSQNDLHYGKRPLFDSENAARKRSEDRNPQTLSPSPAPDAANEIPAPRSQLSGAFAAYQETMRQFLTTQERVLAAVLGNNLPPVGVPVPAPTQIHDKNPAATGSEKVEEDKAETPIPAPAEPSPDAGEETVFTRDKIVDLLLTAVSSTTGYPREMLKLDQDLESELGIDSIKRMEILQAFQNGLPPRLVTQLSHEMDVLSRSKTLDGIVNKFMEAMGRLEGKKADLSGEKKKTMPGSQASGGSREVVTPIAEAGTGVLSGCPRFVMRGISAPLPPVQVPRLDGLVLITRDARGLSEILSHKLENFGAHCVELRPEDFPNGRVQEIIEQNRKKFGPISGIIHLMGLDPSSKWPESLDAWRQNTSLAVKNLFYLIKASHVDLAAGQPRNIVAVSMMGGYFGRNRLKHPVNPAPAACLGLLATLRAEIFGVRAKMLDLDPILSPEQICEAIIGEIAGEDDRMEVGFPEGKRTVFEVSHQELETPLEQTPVQLPSDAVIVATGGATGITAEILKQFARPGMRLCLIGRSPHHVEASELAALATAADLRQHFISAARQSSAPSTPSLIEQQVTNVLRDRDRKKTLDSLRSRGIEVEYYKADMARDASEVLEKIYAKFGRIDAVLHGAGVIADKMIPEKSVSSFDAVFDTKADSTFLLSKHLRAQTLKLMVLFASTAGRFGNVGQCDYAAANELLNRMAWCLRERWPHCRVLSINWGPWAGPGMASAAINQKFLDRGITPIPTAAGCEFFCREVASGKNSEVEVIAGDGPWRRRGSV
jgi:acyl transferase domain-containing protein/NAD(P)H-dependent flavin oxidoreductase YrpB (nitropropane dioxygenase family)/NAD(P)-dependent dehydrogenase (short-subunit alcohol dehydrogenase family)